MTTVAAADPTHARTWVPLRSDARGPRRARRIVREACAGTTLPSRIVDDAVFVVGELVTGSIRQAGGPVELAVDLDRGQVTVRVHDAAPYAPAPTGASFGEVRSWDVVRRLSSTFGYRCDGRRREVWACLRAGLTTITAS